jgi:hypothetical protein
MEIIGNRTKFGYLAFSISYSVTSFIFLPLVSPSVAVLIAIHSVPDILYCLQLLSCSTWQGENSGAGCSCVVGKLGFLAETECV